MCFMQMEEEKGKEMIEKINDKERKKNKMFPLHMFGSREENGKEEKTRNCSFFICFV